MNKIFTKFSLQRWIEEIICFLSANMILFEFYRSTNSSADSNSNDWNNQSNPYNDPLKQLSLLIWNILQKSSIKYNSDSISKTFIFTLLIRTCRTFSNISFCLLHVAVNLVKLALPNSFDGGSMLNRVRWWKNHLETLEKYQSYCLNG